MEEPSAPGTTPSQPRPAAAERGLRARGHAGVSSLGLRVCARARVRVSSAPCTVVQPPRKAGVTVLQTGEPGTCLQQERLSSQKASRSRFQCFPSR